MIMQYIVIGQSPFVDVSVGVGPFRSVDRAFKASEELTYKGYNTEIVELTTVEEIGSVHNDEGAEA